VLVGDRRAGDNLYTVRSSRSSGHGEIASGRFASPPRRSRLDAVQTPIFSTSLQRESSASCWRRQAATDFIFLLDRKTGEHLATNEFIDQTWRAALTRGASDREPKRRRLRRRPSSKPGSDARRTGWRRVSIRRPDCYVMARRIFSVFYRTVEGQVEGWGGRTAIFIWIRHCARSISHRCNRLEPRTRRRRRYRWIVTTAGICFSLRIIGKFAGARSDDRKDFVAPQRWRAYRCRAIRMNLPGAIPIVPVGDTMYAFSLPEKSRREKEEASGE